MAKYVVNIIVGRPDKTHTIREVIGVASTIQSARKMSIGYIGKSKDRFTIISIKPSLKKGSRFTSTIRSLDEIDEEFAFGKGDVEVMNYEYKDRYYLTAKPPLYDEYAIGTDGRILFKRDYWN